MGLATQRGRMGPTRERVGLIVALAVWARRLGHI